MASKQTQDAKKFETSPGLCIGCVCVHVVGVCVYVLGKGDYLLVVKMQKKSEEIQDV